MSRITDLVILQEFTNDSVAYGLYWCKFEGGKHKLFTRNGDDFKVLTHYCGNDELDEIRDDVASGLLQEIKILKEAKTNG